MHYLNYGKYAFCTNLLHVAIPVSRVNTMSVLSCDTICLLRALARGSVMPDSDSGVRIHLMSLDVRFLSSSSHPAPVYNWIGQELQIGHTQ